jgi:hypothetical protein
MRSAENTMEREQQDVEVMDKLKAATLARSPENLMILNGLRVPEAEQQDVDEAQSQVAIKECECCF